MLVSDAIRQIKLATHDAIDEYSQEHCLDFLNHAIQQAASMLAAGKYPPIVKEVILEDGDKIPDNFLSCCGMYPIRITSNRVEILDDDEFEIRFRYFASPELITSETEKLPFPHEALNTAIVKLATILALNENEFDVSQDNNLMLELQQAIASAMGSGS